MVYSTRVIMFQPFHEVELRVLYRSYKLICSCKNQCDYLIQPIASETIRRGIILSLILVANNSLFSFENIQRNCLKGAASHSNGYIFGKLVVISHRDWTTQSSVLYSLKENIPSTSLVSIFLLLIVLSELALFGVVIWSPLLT